MNESIAWLLFPTNRSPPPPLARNALLAILFEYLMTKLEPALEATTLETLTAVSGYAVQNRNVTVRQ